MELERFDISTLSPTFLEALPDEDLFELADAVEERLGRSVLKDDDRGTAAERRLSRELREDWEGDLDPILADELGELPASNVTPGEVGTLLDRTDVRMKDRDTSRALSLLATGFAAFYLEGKRRTKTALEPTRPAAAARIEATLSRVDRDAIRVLSGDQVWWIGEFWGRHLSRTILATVQREALVRGLGRVDVGEILRGAVRGTFPMAAVPGTYRGSPEAYFAQLAGDVRSRGSNFASIGSFAQAGITRYRVEATMDERTTAICTELNGKIFTVEEGVAFTERVLAAEDPEAVKDVAGWKSAEEVRELEARGASLAENGLASPPYHARCRTVLIPE